MKTECFHGGNRHFYLSDSSLVTDSFAHGYIFSFRYSHVLTSYKMLWKVDKNLLTAIWSRRWGRPIPWGRVTGGGGPPSRQTATILPGSSSSLRTPIDPSLKNHQKSSQNHHKHSKTPPRSATTPLVTSEHSSLTLMGVKWLFCDLDKL